MPRSCFRVLEDYKNNPNEEDEAILKSVLSELYRGAEFEAARFGKQAEPMKFWQEDFAYKWGKPTKEPNPVGITETSFGLRNEWIHWWRGKMVDFYHEAQGVLNNAQN